MALPTPARKTVHACGGRRTITIEAPALDALPIEILEDGPRDADDIAVLMAVGVRAWAEDDQEAAESVFSLLEPYVTGAER